MNYIRQTYYKALRIKSRLLHGKPVFVFMYHRINDHVLGGLSKLTVSVDNFEEQLIYFTKKFQFLRLDSDWSTKRNTAAVLTFDDGYADMLLNVLPLLEKYNVPATFFITTEVIQEQKEYWWDRLAAAYQDCPHVFNIPGNDIKVSKNDYTYLRMARFVLEFKNAEKEQWISNFEACNGVSYTKDSNYRILTPQELKFLSEHPLIDIGIHTHSHYQLKSMTYEEQKEDILLSMKILDTLVDKKLDYLALPHGSYNNDTIRVAEDLGLKGILLANDKYSNAKNKSGKKINRIIMPDIEGEALRNYIRQFEYLNIIRRR